MQLRILDQVHLSGVRTSTLAAGELVEVSRVLGDELLVLADQLEFVGMLLIAAGKAEDAPAEEKSAPAPANKAEDAPANKSDKPAHRKRSAKAD